MFSLTEVLRLHAAVDASKAPVDPETDYIDHIEFIQAAQDMLADVKSALREKKRTQAALEEVAQAVHEAEEAAIEELALTAELEAELNRARPAWTRQ